VFRFQLSECVLGVLLGEDAHELAYPGEFPKPVQFPFI